MPTSTAGLDACLPETCIMNAPKSKPLPATATDLVQAVETLYRKLHQGSVKVHGKKRPIHGDFRLLRHADGLSKDEQLLLDNYSRITKSLAGTQEVGLSKA